MLGKNPIGRHAFAVDFYGFLKRVIETAFAVFRGQMQPIVEPYGLLKRRRCGPHKNVFIDAEEHQSLTKTGNCRLVDANFSYRF